MNKFLTIAKAWGIAVFHTQEQKDLADARMQECVKCENLQEVDVKNMTGGLVNNYFMCGACGCPLQGKIYTSVDTAIEQKCPLKKWEK